MKGKALVLLAAGGFVLGAAGGFLIPWFQVRRYLNSFESRIRTLEQSITYTESKAFDADRHFTNLRNMIVQAMWRVKVEPWRVQRYNAAEWDTAYSLLTSDVAGLSSLRREIQGLRSDLQSLETDLSLWNTFRRSDLFWMEYELRKLESELSSLRFRQMFGIQ
jgi:hypothetical protein